MGISCTPIFLSERVVYKITNLIFQKVMQDCRTDLAVWMSSWSSDDSKPFEFFRICMFLTPLQLVLVIQ